MKDLTPCASWHAGEAPVTISVVVVISRVGQSQVNQVPSQEVSLCSPQPVRVRPLAGGVSSVKKILHLLMVYRVCALFG